MIEVKRVKVLNGYTAKAQFLAELDDNTATPDLFILRDATTFPRDRYSYSMTFTVHHHFKHGDVVIIEVSHRRYEVYQVPAGVRRFISHDEACDVAQGLAA